VLKTIDRIEYLDSIRGIGALIVVLSHYETFLPLISKEGKIFKGSVAVSIFFVLSGYVLSKSLKCITRLSLIDLIDFIIKRFCRLWIPFAAALLISLSIHHFSNKINITLNSFSSEYVERWEQKVIKNQVKNELIEFYSPNLLAPSWTLKPEFYNSIILVLFILVFKKPTLYLISATILFSYLNTITLGAVQFALGSLLYYHETKISQIIKNSKIAMPGIIFIVIVIFIPQNIISLTSNWTILGLLGFAILAFVQATKSIQSILNQTVLKFIGKISFGIYLMHWPIMFIILPIFHKNLKNSSLSNHSVWCITALICMLITILVSILFYNLVEKPSIQLGKILVNILHKKTLWSILNA